MKRMLRSLAMVLTMSLLLTMLLSATTHAESVVNYTVGSVTVKGMIKEGETIKVRVGVMPVSALCMMEIHLRYDDELFEAVEGSLSAFTASNYEMAQVNVAPIDNQTGEPISGMVLINAMSINDTKVTTQTAVATVVLKAKRDVHTDSALILEKALAARTPTVRLECATLNGTITVSKGDVNEDGSVGLSDAIRVMYAVNGVVELSASQRIMADLDGDGNVTLLDAVRLFYRVA